jgi:hypothetical protein
LGQQRSISAGIEERDATTPAMASTLTPWQLRSGYFWYYAAIGAFAPFIPLYYQDLGMSGLQLGVLLFVAYLMSSGFAVINNLLRAPNKTVVWP